MVIDCQKMLVYYLGSPTDNESAVDSSKIDKIIALGNVTVNRSDGSMARAGKAVYYQGEGRIVLTENPSVQQGRDVVEGHKIIILLNENRSIVEGSETKRVKATIFPKEEKGKE
ncbi:Lipopolysaccharide export system protein LptA [subsurface metagenome]